MSIHPFEKDKALRRKMVFLGIREEDIQEHFVRSSGPGGQNVNKTSSCVQLKHLPTGIEVKCQQERSQLLNRLLARELLVNKIEEGMLKRAAFERSRREKEKRKNRRRSHKAKQIMLEGKKRRAEKKKLRSKPNLRDIE
jgi:protein subunit release factor B